MNLEIMTSIAEQAMRQDPWKEGDDGKIFLIGDDVVFKLFYDMAPGFRSYKEMADHEFKLGTLLSSHGIQVPHYYGVYKPSNPPDISIFKDYFWGVFMERIHGVHHAELCPQLQDRAETQFEIQCSLIKDLGIEISDNSGVGSNTLYDLNRDMLFLLDLIRWEIVS